MRSIPIWMTTFWLGVTVILFHVFAHSGGQGIDATLFILSWVTWLVYLTHREHWGVLKQRWVLLWLAFVIWACLSWQWSNYVSRYDFPAGWQVLLLGPALMTVPLAFTRLSVGAKEIFAHLFMATSVVAVGVMLLDVISGFGLSILVEPPDPGQHIIFRQNDAELNVGRGIMTAAQTALPVIALMLVYLKRWRWLAALLIIGICAAAALNRLTLVFPILVLGLAMGVYAWYFPKKAVGLALSLAIASLLFAPLVGFVASLASDDILTKLPLSWEHRVRMWAYVGDRIWEAPLTGHGFDNARTYSETFRAADGRDIQIVSMHPHNVGLQLWLETGVIGVLLLCGFLASLARPLIRFASVRARAVGLSGLILAGTFNGALTIGIWQYWWWAALLMGGCVLAFIPEGRSQPHDTDHV